MDIRKNISEKRVVILEILEQDAQGSGRFTIPGRVQKMNMGHGLVVQLAVLG